MRSLIIIASVCITLTAHSQGTVFKIITFSDGVMIDGSPVVINTDVTSASKEISIPKDGSLGVITVDGYLYELKNSMAVAEVIPFIKSKQPIPTGAKHRPYPMPLEPVLFTTSPFLLTDSLFLSWEEDAEKDRLPLIEYVIRFTDYDDRELGRQNVNQNWAVINMAPYFEYSKNVVITVQSLRTRSSITYLAQMKSDDDKLRRDIERMTTNDMALMSAIFDVNKYSHDRNFLIYKVLMSRTYKPSGVLMTYVGRLQSQLDLK